MWNTVKQILSISIGFLLGVLGAIYAFNTVRWFSPTLLSLLSSSTGAYWVTLILGLILGILVFLYVFVYGLRALGPAKGREEVEEGAVKFLGGYLSFKFNKRWMGFYTAPPGISWWLPYPLGGITPVDIRRRELDRTSTNGTPITKVTTRENAEVSVSLLIPFRVTNIWAYVNTDDVIKQFTKISEQAIRHYVSIMWMLDMAHRLGEISGAIKGDKALYTIDALEIAKSANDVSKMRDGEPIETIRVNLESRYNPASRAHEIGIEVIDPAVDDIILPSEVVAAMVAKRTEEAEVVSETIQAKNLNRLIKIIKEGHSGISDEAALYAALAQQNHAKVIHVSGNAGDFTKGAAINTSKGEGTDA